MSSGTVRPEVVAKTLREHNAERERLAQLHEKSEEEHTRQLSNMRHVESVAILIKEHDAKAEEHERKIIDQNERSLALEKQTTRELSKNFKKSKNDVERLNVCVFVIFFGCFHFFWSNIQFFRQLFCARRSACSVF